jgi:hypothetical protein
MKCTSRPRRKGYGTGSIFICTPNQGSWLNKAEIELNIIHEQCLNRKIDDFKKWEEKLKQG